MRLVAVYLAGFTGLLTLTACGEDAAPPVRQVTLPDWADCRDIYTSEERVEAVMVRGDTEAARCGLALFGSDTPEPIRFEAYYLIYRLEGFEPEGLDAMVRAMEREHLAARLRNYHDFTEPLEPFPEPWWALGCPVYDAPAQNLLLRTRPSENMECLPRGQR